MSDLERIPWTPALDVREVMRVNAESVINVEAGDPRTRATLEELLGPVEGRWDLDRQFRCWLDARGRWRTEGVSTCGLVAEGLWRRAGVAAPWLTAEYVPGTAIMRARRFAERISPRPAIVFPGDDRIPGVGDYVVIGKGLGMHALTAIGWQGDALVSVDGGQLGRGGLQAIHRNVRPWRSAGRSASLGERAVQYWIDVTLLPYAGSVTVPKGAVVA